MRLMRRIDIHWPSRYFSSGKRGRVLMSRRYWTDSWSKGMLQALGKKPDIVIAREFGLAKPTVRKKRQSLGIPPFSDSFQLTASMKKMLGRRSDLELGKRWGVSGDAVRLQRMKLCIPAHHPRAIQRVIFAVLTTFKHRISR